MKTPWPLMTLALGTAMMAPVQGGTLTYTAIPAQNSDTQAGLRSENIYTSAVDGGSLQDSDRIINGVALHPLKGSGNTAIADHVTISVASGALGNTTLTPSTDGLVGAALADALVNEQADDNSEQYIVLDPSSLKAGQIYDLRVYIAPTGQQGRSVNLSFLGDGKEPVSTDFFNEDDATTTPGKFTATSQAYYINYRYTWDGTTTPGFTVTQKSGKNPFLLFALTNQIAVVEAPAPIEVADASASAEAPQTVEPTDAGATAQESTELAVTGEPGPPATAGTEEATPNPITAGTGPQQVDSTPVQTTAEEVPPQVTGPETSPTESEPTEIASSRTAASVERFYGDQTLSHNGRWVDVEGYGRCWQPQDVKANWKPYTVGAWQYSTTVGWTWTSPEPWALSTYHYGRWILINNSGWCWVPGVQWAPAWCAWRYGHGYVGWAPLPPEADLAQAGAIEASVDTACDIGPKFYTFCKTEDLGAEDLSTVIVSEEQVVTLLPQTRNVTALCLKKGLVYCGGPKFETIRVILKKAHHHDIVLVNANSLIGPNLKITPHPKHLPNVVAHYKVVQIDRGWSAAKGTKIVSAPIPVRRIVEDKVRIEKPRHVEHVETVTKIDAPKHLEVRDRAIEKKVTHQVVVEHPKVIEEHVKPVVVAAPPQEVVVKHIHPTPEKVYVAHYVKRDDRCLAHEQWRVRKVAFYGPHPMTYNHGYRFSEHHHLHNGHEDLYAAEHSRFDDRPHHY